MANNRMFMRCDVCGEEIMMASHMGDPWSMSKSMDDMYSFFDRHYRCQVRMTEYEEKNGIESGKGICWDDQDHYSLVFESDKNYGQNLPEGVETHFINNYNHRMELEAPDKLYKTAYNDDKE